MDEKATQIVSDYIWEHLDKSDKQPESVTVYIVWKCKILQN